jgi:hypothetical protein
MSTWRAVEPVRRIDMGSGDPPQQAITIGTTQLT